MSADTDPAATHIGGAEVSIGGRDGGHVSTSVANQIQSAVESNTQHSLISDAKQMVHAGMEPLTGGAQEAVHGSQLDQSQQKALTPSVISTGRQSGINPNFLVGLAQKESTFDPTATNGKSSAEGLYQLEEAVRRQFGLSDADATGSSPAAITHQTEAAGGYLRQLMRASTPSSHPEHQFEIALGYFRGSRREVNKAMSSTGGFQSLLKLSFGGENFGITYHVWSNTNEAVLISCLLVDLGPFNFLVSRTCSGPSPR